MHKLMPGQWLASKNSYSHQELYL
uniref:Uncharacterized protein n=1 Tax=Arundo donax TaxID=35708 RepID=A0A0A9ERU2_ARUDO